MLGRTWVLARDEAGFNENRRGTMNQYQIGGGLKLLTALEKTQAFAEFLQNRMSRSLEAEDPTELHYLLAQLDDYHSYMWRYYQKLRAERGDRGNLPG
jgi:hypothetical protein